MSDDPEFKLKERFVWKWNPHGWLTTLIIVILIILFRNFAR